LWLFGAADHAPANPNYYKARQRGTLPGKHCAPRIVRPARSNAALECSTLTPDPASDRPRYATLSDTGRKRGPMPRRRFQKGCLVKEAGGWYSMFYLDVDGATKRKKQLLGHVATMSRRCAQREHLRLIQAVNESRGSIAPVIRGQTFEQAVNQWRSAVAPNLSPATVRARESYLRVHILPRFGQTPLAELGLHQLQQFATDLRRAVSGKTIVHILTTIFAVLRYAERCGMRVQKVGFADLQLGSTTRETPVPFFTREQVAQILDEAPEPFKTIFTVAWYTGLRAGELLALTVDDLNFGNLTINVSKSADDQNRVIRQPKTPKSVAVLPMPSALAAMLREYLLHHWSQNDARLLFPAPRKAGYPRGRYNVVRALKKVLRKLGIPDANLGLHGFRHGLATELVHSNVPLTTVQQQMRHSDVLTTLRVYAHAIPQVQRDAMESIGTKR